jgi:hypothetical protein
MPRSHRPVRLVIAVFPKITPTPEKIRKTHKKPFL